MLINPDENKVFLLLAMGGLGCLYHLSTPPQLWGWPALVLFALWWARGMAKSWSTSQFFFAGWWFGFCSFSFSYSFLPHLLSNYSPFGPLTPVVILLAGLYHGLFFGFSGGCARWLVGRGHSMLFAFPLTFALFEFWYPQIFPLQLCHAFLDLPIFLQSAELWGGLGVSFLLYFFNALFAYTWLAWYRSEPEDKGWYRGAFWSALLLFSLLLYGFFAQVRWSSPSEEKIRLGVIQPEIWIEQMGVDSSLKKLPRLLYEASLEEADLLVLPETVVKIAPPEYTRKGVKGVYRPAPVPPWYPLDIEAMQVGPEQFSPPTRVEVPLERSLWNGHRTPILFGANAVDLKAPPGAGVQGRAVLYNSAFLADGEGRVLGVAQKNYLLAFGEYLPFGDWFPDLYRWFPNAGSLSSGEEVEVLTLGEIRLGILICYEDLLGHMGRKVARKEPQVLINLTNDAWFGRSFARGAHAQLARMRSLELRKDMVRCTTTGVSVWTNPAGEVVEELELGQEAIGSWEVDLRSGVTFYALSGWWQTLLMTLLWLLFALWKRDF